MAQKEKKQQDKENQSLGLEEGPNESLVFRFLLFLRLFGVRCCPIWFAVVSWSLLFLVSVLKKRACCKTRYNKCCVADWGELHAVSLFKTPHPWLRILNIVTLSTRRGVIPTPLVPMVTFWKWIETSNQPSVFSSYDLIVHGNICNYQTKSSLAVAHGSWKSNLTF